MIFAIFYVIGLGQVSHCICWGKGGEAIGDR